MANQQEVEILEKIAVNIVLQKLSEQMLALLRSYLMSSYNATLDENGDLSCSLYELGLALEKLVGVDEAQLFLQEIYVEIDALTDMSQNSTA